LLRREQPFSELPLDDRQVLSPRTELLDTDELEGVGGLGLVARVCGVTAEEICDRALGNPTNAIRATAASAMPPATHSDSENASSFVVVTLSAAIGS
jgi:hypothetical protein